MAKKRTATLEKRIAQLKEQGIDLGGAGHGTTVSRLAEVAGDLTLGELREMQALVEVRAYSAAMSSAWVAGRAAEAEGKRRAAERGVK